jgi:hypothetical protein
MRGNMSSLKVREKGTKGMMGQIEGRSRERDLFFKYKVGEYIEMEKSKVAE